MSQQESGSSSTGNPSPPTPRGAGEDLGGTPGAAAEKLAENRSTDPSGSQDNANVGEVEASAGLFLKSPQPVGQPPDSPPPPTPSATQLPQSPSSKPALPSDEVLLSPHELPLSRDDISKFEEDGFVMLKQAFDTKVAAACR